MTKLCPECETSGRCWFKKKAEIIAECAPKRVNLDTKLANALAIHKIIANLRIRARERGCPNVNEVDPDYLGKEML